LKTTGLIIEDTEMENHLGKAKFTSAKGVQAHRNSKHEEQAVCPVFIPNAVGFAPLLGLVKLEFTICS
jgi:hypothetical protein